MEKIDFYINHRNERERQVLDALTSSRAKYATGVTALDIVSAIYVGLPPPLLHAAGQNVVQHLKKLLAEGTVTVSEDGGVELWAAVTGNNRKM